MISLVIKLQKEPNISAKCKAFSYQIEAVNAIKNLEYAAVFHEQGLGKSKIAIDLMLYWLKEKQVDTVLYVTKKGLVQNWVREFRSHTYMTPKVLDQNVQRNYYVFNSPSRLILTHYEVLNSEFERFKLFLKTRDIAIIVDESAKIKNPETHLTQCFFELSPLFKKRVIMTGTPVANRPYDIWAQIFFLDQGKSLGCNFSEFKNKADITNKLSENQNKREIFENFIEDIFKRIKSFSVRETKESGKISLPEKIIDEVTADWEPRQFELYRSIQEDLRAVVINEGALTEDCAEEYLKRILRLVQIASNPALVDESYHEIPGKFKVLINLLDSFRQKNEKCLIWTNFTENVDWLYKSLKDYGAVKVHGKMNIHDRNKAIDKFLYNDNIKIFIATPASAKEGLTLTVANNVVFYDRNFSLDDYLQAQDRIHRISQDKTCYVFNIIMDDSIDQWVDVLLEAKYYAAKLAQGDITLDYYRSHMNYDFGKILNSILNVADTEAEG